MEDLRLSENDAEESIHPRFVCDPAGLLHMVWKDNGSHHNAILYRAGSGSDWGQSFTISHPDTHHNSPHIAIDPDRNLHTVFLRWTGIPWGDYDVGYRRYDHDLGAWGQEERLTKFEGIGLSGQPTALCDAAGAPYVFWLWQDAPTRIWYRKQEGECWLPREAVTGEDDQPNGYYGVALSPDGAIHCVWQDYRSGTAELYHSYLRDDVWSPSVAITNDGYASVHPRLAPDAVGNIHLVYGGGRYLSQKIHVLFWDRVTETWSELDVFASAMAQPCVFLDVDPQSEDLHISWADFVSGRMEILYKHYDADTGLWDPTEQITSGNPEMRGDPEIGLDPQGNPHLAWWDMRDMTGQQEVYYTAALDPSAVAERPGGLAAGLPLRIVPNPCRDRATLYLEGGAARSLAVFNSDGRLLRELPPASAGCGVVWDGRDRSGRRCAEGVYLVRGGAPDSRIVRRLVLMR
ncbi:MAG: hypothetical protein GF330_13755 [Candidatus Eisenbacteria bacterium]|nr:hypothetical protein [Candidatus Eisenbacteria bacterium]